ncbi:DNA/RNA helicase domain-containing protein [Streptomyces sp. RLB1-33]|nr:DNA/RNA helicase domain-containing protein [Streptomyces sp. RLB1-33]
MSWNSRADAPDLDHPDVQARPFWATDPGGHHQVGCIYTAQGMEYAYNAVIMGGDLIRQGDRWIANPDASRDPPTPWSSRSPLPALRPQQLPRPGHPGHHRHPLPRPTNRLRPTCTRCFPHTAHDPAARLLE